MSSIRFYSISLFLIAGLGAPVFTAQSQTLVQGHITDTETQQSVGFATIRASEAKLGAVADENGSFTLKSDKPFYEIQISALGYRTKSVRVLAGKSQTLNISLTPENQQLQEVTVRPEKYRNKRNPSVELIRLVIDNRDRNRMESLSFYQEAQYEKVLVGLTHIPDKWKDKKALKSIRFVLENEDTTKSQDAAVVPLLLQEHVIDFYSRKQPATRRKYIRGTQSVTFPDLLNQQGIDEAMRYLNQDIDVYDNFIDLFTNQFLSPIADKAPLFYRYYPVDTTEENGAKIVHLSFFPRNKTDMLLQGDLYIALDSTYPVTKAVFTINPLINLNFVKSLQLEQGFQQLPSGKWMPAYEDTRIDFGITKKGMGFFGQRLVSHSKPVVPLSLPDSLFDTPTEYVTLPQASRQDSSFWTEQRYAPLTQSEAATYKVMDSLQTTKLFSNTAKIMDIAISGFFKISPTVDLGPWVTFFAFNPVEGNRFRLGGRTSAGFSRKWYLDGYAAYGTKDERWKYGGNLAYSFSEKRHYQFPSNALKFSYLRDIRVPGLDLFLFQSNGLNTSFVRGVNDRFFFIERYTLQYDREFQNHFSFNLGVERQSLTPEGSLSFEPVTDGSLAENAPVRTTKAYIQLRYAPKETFYQNSVYRQQIDLTYIAKLRYAHSFNGVLGGQYNFHELTANVYKFTRTPPFGYNYLWLEGGGVFGRATYPLLVLHRANQTYISQLYSYNLMNFMEFISDRYVALHVDQNFYGFFLNKVPLLRRLKLREMVGFKVLYGTISSGNRPDAGSNLYRLPAYPDGRPISYSLEQKPYIEAQIGIGNIFKIVRIDLIRRFSYLDHPGVSKFGIRGQLKVYF